MADEENAAAKFKDGKRYGMHFISNANYLGVEGKAPERPIIVDHPSTSKSPLVEASISDSVNGSF